MTRLVVTRVEDDTVIGSVEMRGGTAVLDGPLTGFWKSLRRRAGSDEGVFEAISDGSYSNGLWTIQPEDDAESKAWDTKDRYALVDAPEACEYCKSPATKKIIHSEAMAYIPVCGEHLDKGKHDAEHCTPDGTRDPSNVDYIRDVKETKRWNPLKHPRRGEDPARNDGEFVETPAPEMSLTEALKANLDTTIPFAQRLAGARKIGAKFNEAAKGRQRVEHAIPLTEETMFEAEMDPENPLHDMVNRTGSSLASYGYYGYQPVNALLRLGQGDMRAADHAGLVPEIRDTMDVDEAEDVAANLRELLAQSRTTEDIVVYRGLTSGKTLLGGLTWQDSDELRGLRFTDHAFVSTSPDSRTPIALMDSIIATEGERGGEPVFMEILVPKGTPAIFKEDGDSTEVLLADGLTFEVITSHLADSESNATGLQVVVVGQSDRPEYKTAPYPGQRYRHGWIPIGRPTITDKPVLEKLKPKDYGENGQIDLADAHPDLRQAMHDIFDMEHGGLSFRVDDDMSQVYPDYPSGHMVARAEGQIYDGDKIVGSFRREVRPETGEVHNDSFSVRAEHQRQGHSTAFNDHQDQQLAAHGFERLTISPAYNGGYASARRGFAWRTDKIGAYGDVLARMAMAGMSATPEQRALIHDWTDRFTGPQSEWPTPAEIAGSGEFGRSLMDGSSWAGERPLSLGGRHRTKAETKAGPRYVRTRAGEEHYGLPMGAMIVADDERVPSFRHGGRHQRGPTLDRILEGLDVPGSVTFEFVSDSGVSAQTQHAILPNGAHVIKKTDDRNSIIAEYLGGLVGQAVGAPVPVVTPPIEHPEGGSPSVIMGFVSDAVPGRSVTANQDNMEDIVQDRLMHTDQAVLLGLLDALTMNTDRNGGNWLWDEEEEDLTGIDMGRAWFHAFDTEKDKDGEFRPYHHVAIESPDWNRRGVNQWAKHFIQPSPFGTLEPAQWAEENPMSPEDMEVIGQRLQELKPVFQQYNLGWWIVMWSNYESIAKRATGTESRL